MKRRNFIAVLGGAVAWPLAADAQQQSPVVGYLSSRSADSEALLVASMRRGLAETGFVEGHNVAFAFRFANGQESLLPLLAAELVRQPVTLLFATSRPSALAAKAATGTIPIVFTSGVDPVQDGLVQSFNRPGGNATGINVFTSQLSPKRLELLRELVTNAKLIAFMVNPGGSTAPMQIEEVQAAARTMNQQILVVNASNEKEIAKAFAAKPGGLAGGTVDEIRDNRELENREGNGVIRSAADSPGRSPFRMRSTYCRFRMRRNSNW